MAFYSRTGLVEVKPGISAVIMSTMSEGGGPNAGLIIAGEQVIVIDSLMSPASGRQLMEYLRQITNKSPTYLINTHSHGDHVFGNQVFSPPATIIAPENVRDVLLSRGQEMVKSFAERFSDLLPDIGDTTIVAPHMTYRDRVTLHFAGYTIDLIHPGVAHTNGDTIVYLPDEKVVFAGDIVFNHIFPPIFGSSGGWIAAIEQLEAMDIDTIVPGHGFVATKQDLAVFKQFLVELRDQVKECFLRGLSPEQAANKIHMPYLQWPYSERLGRDVQVIYEELKKE